MPLLRTDTGCRCRKTLVSMTTTRLRRSRGAGWRKMLFQTWLFLMKSPTDMSAPFRTSDRGLRILSIRNPRSEVRNRLHLDERLRVAPLAALLLELPALVHDDLAVVADADGP